MSNVWYTSDLHLFHRNVSYQRRNGGYWPQDKSLVTPEDVDWHNNLLAQQWDQAVSSDDTVWVLGDLTANDKNIPDAVEWIQERPGTKHLVAGNHDPVHPLHSNAHRWQAQYLEAFHSVQAFAKKSFVINGKKTPVKLSHFPWAEDGSEEVRYDEWRLRPTDDFLLHGHTHSINRFSGKEIHVGVDAWGFGPVPQAEIIDYMRSHLGN